MKIALIKWIDSWGTPNLWEHLCDVGEASPSRPWSVGFIFEETEDHITLLGTFSQNQVMSRLCIPKVSILDIFHLDSPLKVERVDDGFSVTEREERDVDTKLKEGAP